jgi:hypothetical protein
MGHGHPGNHLSSDCFAALHNETAQSLSLDLLLERGAATDTGICSLWTAALVFRAPRNGAGMAFDGVGLDPGIGGLCRYGLDHLSRAARKTIRDEDAEAREKRSLASLLAKAVICVIHDALQKARAPNGWMCLPCRRYCSGDV